MAQLAIKGHPTKGKEIIEILEMLGGWNYNHWDGKASRILYFINGNTIEVKTIRHNTNIDEFNVFTLEEFEEKYPYKVGDTVACYVGIILEKEIHTITGMQWDSDKCRILYYLDNCDVIKVEDILYRTECKIEQSKPKRIKDMDLKNYGTATIKYIQENGSRDMELIIPYNQEIVNIDGRYILRDKKPQYPKTYKECCEVIDYVLEGETIIGYKASLLRSLQKLLICRDAYWKIAGEEMGLGKPWEPEWTIYKHKFCLGTDKDKVIEECVTTGNRILAFPTKEMRDKFYNNFKELIEECKELL